MNFTDIRYLVSFQIINEVRLSTSQVCSCKYHMVKTTLCRLICIFLNCGDGWSFPSCTQNNSISLYATRLVALWECVEVGSDNVCTRACRARACVCVW